MPKYKSIVVVGSSGAGKTTLVNGLRTPEFTGRLSIPKRYITRPARKGDDLTENSYVSKEEFKEMVAAGTIYPYWQRELDNGRIEKYGFEADNSEKLHVYSANNAFLRDDNESLQNVLKDAVVVVAASNPDERADRLTHRSPDMANDEKSVRLADHADDVLARENIIIIDTTDLSPGQGQEQIRTRARNILEDKEL